MLANYKEKDFKSIADADLGLETEDEKEEIKKLSEENEPLLAALGKALEGKVKKVELTGRLKSHPCCLRAEGPVTLEMEKVLNQQAMDDSQRVHAERVLELNAEHPVSYTHLYAGAVFIRTWRLLFHQTAVKSRLSHRKGMDHCTGMPEKVS